VSAILGTAAHNVIRLPIHSPKPWVSPAPLPGKIDLNSADLEALVSLPGIGEHLAELIIEARERCPFSYLEDLSTIPGIGERRLEAIRPLVCILPP
jgi:competence ComEA-like helix-hairpin-helix protein